MIESWLWRSIIGWKQRSRAEWLKAGDRNTTFSILKHRNAETEILSRSCSTEGREWFYGKEEIIGELENYFSKIFSTSLPTESEINLVLESVELRLSPETAPTLAKSILATPHILFFILFFTSGTHYLAQKLKKSLTFPSLSFLPWDTIGNTSPMLQQNQGIVLLNQTKIVRFYLIFFFIFL